MAFRTAHAAILAAAFPLAACAGRPPTRTPAADEAPALTEPAPLKLPTGASTQPLPLVTAYCLSGDEKEGDKVPAVSGQRGSVYGEPHFVVAAAELGGDSDERSGRACTFMSVDLVVNELGEQMALETKPEDTLRIFCGVTGRKAEQIFSVKGGFSVAPATDDDASPVKILRDAKQEIFGRLEAGRHCDVIPAVYLPAPRPAAR